MGCRDMSESLQLIGERRKERRRALASMIASSSLDVTAKGMSRADPDFQDPQSASLFESNIPSAHNRNHPKLKRKYKIDTSLLGGTPSLVRSRQRKKESRETELKRRKKEDALVEALFPGSPSEREFEANSTTQLLCDHVKLMLRTILNKSADQAAAFNNALVLFDDTAVQALAIVIEEIARGHVENWEAKLVPLLKPSVAAEADKGPVAVKNENIEDLFGESDSDE